jgi:hypothetical protein
MMSISNFAKTFSSELYNPLRDLRYAQSADRYAPAVLGIQYAKIALENNNFNVAKTLNTVIQHGNTHNPKMLYMQLK